MNEASQTQDGWTFNGIKMPLVLKDQTIFDAGVWNGYLYDARAVKSIFDHTDWTDDDRRALYRDHHDGSVDGKSGMKLTSDWIGRVSNPKFVESGRIVGDVEIWEPNMATLLNYAKPKFGVSASVFSQFQGKEVLGGFIRNSSIVINPAVKTAYINNSEAVSDELEFAKTKNNDKGGSMPESNAVTGVKNLSEEEVKKIVDEAVKNNMMDEEMKKKKMMEDEDMKKKKMMEEEEHKKMKEAHEKEKMDMMQKVNQMSEEMKAKEAEIKNLNDKLNQPARIGVPQAPSSEQIKFQDVDEGMVALLEHLRKENTISM